MLSALGLACLPAAAADVSMIGTIGDKAAVLAVDGGNPKTVKVGQTWNGITVLEVKGDLATVEIDGQRRMLRRGMHYRSAGAASDRASVTLAADSRGHFFSEGAVNGIPVRFIVDTGARWWRCRRPRRCASGWTTPRASRRSPTPPAARWGRYASTT
ncbi:MAG: hypothetical protein ACT4P3_20025, partial [Betaproteobacteria bacterium]